MKYKYCTKKMVDKAVKQGREAVIKCASDKWWFFGTCTEKQMRRLGKECDLGKNCCLCHYQNKLYPHDTANICETCPLAIAHRECGDSEDSLYWIAYDQFEVWTDNHTATNFKKFQAKARKLARVIGRLK